MYVGGSWHAIQKDAVFFTQRYSLNFKWVGFIVNDNPGDDSTDVQIDPSYLTWGTLKTWENIWWQAGAVWLYSWVVGDKFQIRNIYGDAGVSITEQVNGSIRIALTSAPWINTDNLAVDSGIQSFLKLNGWAAASNAIVWTAPVIISMTPASGWADWYLTQTDWNTFNNKVTNSWSVATNKIAVWTDGTGTTIKSVPVLIDASGNISSPGTLDIDWSTTFGTLGTDTHGFIGTVSFAHAVLMQWAATIQWLLTASGATSFTNATNAFNAIQVTNNSSFGGTIALTNATISGTQTTTWVATFNANTIFNSTTSHVGTATFSGATSLSWANTYQTGATIVLNSTATSGGQNFNSYSGTYASWSTITLQSWSSISNASTTTYNTGNTTSGTQNFSSSYIGNYASGASISGVITFSSTNTYTGNQNFDGATNNIGKSDNSSTNNIRGNTNFSGGIIDFGGSTINWFTVPREKTGNTVSWSNSGTAGEAITAQDALCAFVGKIQTVDTNDVYTFNNPSFPYDSAGTKTIGIAFSATAWQILNFASTKFRFTWNSGISSSSITWNWKVYNATGTLGTNATPTGWALYTSTGSYQSWLINFNTTYTASENISYTIPSTGNYCLMFEMSYWTNNNSWVTMYFRWSSTSGDTISGGNNVLNGAGSLNNPMLLTLWITWGTAWIFKTKANDPSFIQFIWFANATVAKWATISWTHEGPFTKTWVVSWSKYFLSDTAWAIGTSIGTYWCFVWYGSATNVITLSTPSDWYTLNNNTNYYATTSHTLHSMISWSTGAGVVGTAKVENATTLLGTYTVRSGNSYSSTSGTVSCAWPISKWEFMKINNSVSAWQTALNWLYR